MSGSARKTLDDIMTYRWQFAAELRCRKKENASKALKRWYCSLPWNKRDLLSLLVAVGY